MVSRADQTTVMIEASKFGKSGFVDVCERSKIDILVSDCAPPDIRSSKRKEPDSRYKAGRQSAVTGE